MRRLDRSVLVLAVFMFFVSGMLFMPGLVFAGDVEPPVDAVDPGGNPVGTMHTLDEIYNKLEGAEPTVHDLDDIHEKLEVISGQLDQIINASRRFVDLGNGTVKDNYTGLIWLKDAGCVGGNFYDVRTFIGNLEHGDCGLTDGSAPGDWDMPTLAELESLVDTRFSSPALANGKGLVKWREGDVFHGVASDSYWSKTNSSGENYYVVDMADGTTDNEYYSNPNHCWPIRRINQQ